MHKQVTCVRVCVYWLSTGVTSDWSTQLISFRFNLWNKNEQTHNATVTPLFSHQDHVLNLLSLSFTVNETISWLTSYSHRRRRLANRRHRHTSRRLSVPRYSVRFYSDSLRERQWHQDVYMLRTSIHVHHFITCVFKIKLALLTLSHKFKLTPSNIQQPPFLYSD